jgi:hypothetical protein
MRALLLSLFLFTAPAMAQAQDDLPPPEFEGGDEGDELPPPEFGGDDEGGELPPPEFGEGDEGGELPPPEYEEGDPEDAPAEAMDEWQAPKVMVVAAPRTPRELLREVNDLLSEVGQLEGSDTFVREARARGYAPDGAEAFEVLLPEMDLALVLVISVIREEGERRLRVEYRDGRIGFALLEEAHPLAGDRLRAESRERIVAESRLALAAITRPPGAPAPEGLPEAAGEEREGPAPEPGAAVHVFLGAGFGFGMRSFELPTRVGIVRLDTDPFPAVSLRLGLDYEPTAQGRVNLRGDLSYVTSVGLEVTDIRTDGTTLKTPSRSQRVDVRLGATYRLADGPDGVSLGGALGFGLRAFDSEAAVTLPDYALSGFSVRLSLVLPLLEGRLAIEVHPELEWVAFVDDGLTQEGVGDSAVAIGAEGRLLFRIAGPFHAELFYRESHAFLDSELGDSGDVERYATLGLLYRP